MPTDENTPPIETESPPTTEAPIPNLNMQA
jgi:hypothetical protein